LIPYSNPL